MIKQSFYDNQMVENADLNTAIDNCEQGDRDVAKEACGYGITAGLSVISVGGQMQIGVNSGTFIDKLGRRCAYAGLGYHTITEDTAANPVAVGAGQERWVAVFLKVNLKLTDYAEDPTGGVKDITNYTVQTPIVNPNEAAYDPGHGDVNTDQILYVVCGTAAALGEATRPALDSEAILLCDLHVVNGQTDYTGTGVINFQRTELFRKVDADQSGTAVGTGFHLVRQFQRGPKIVREYVTYSGTSVGMLFTTNAEYVAPQGATGNGTWKADDYDEDSRAFSLGGLTVGSVSVYDIAAYYVTGGTFSAPWDHSDWTLRGSTAP